MPYLRDTAILLRVEPFRNEDVWVTCYGLQHGKMTAVARGAKRSRAKQSGHIVPLAEAEVMIAKGALFDTLAVVRVLHPRMELRGRLAALSLAGAFADLVDLLTKPAVADPGIFFLLRELLDLAPFLEQDPSPARGQLVFSGAALKLLDELGYAPPLDECPPHVSESAFKLLRFLRAHPLSDTLRVTASPDLFRETSAAVTSFFTHVPLEREPHGSRTIAFLLDHVASRLP